MSSKITPAIRAALEAAVGAAQVISDAEQDGRLRPRRVLAPGDRPRPGPGGPAGSDRGGRGRPARRPRARHPRDPARRGDGPLRRLRPRPRRDRAVARADGPRPRGRRRQPDGRDRGRRPPLRLLPGGRGGRALFPAAPRRRERHDGRPGRDQRRRQPGRQVRDDPHLRPRASSSSPRRARSSPWAASSRNRAPATT
ncbi:MAG: hypothetical protein MZU95_02225 [Desulfomicrobium escambiense]|nr:hypothetical protein [Desulfomicrobium escambiense]